MAQGQQVKIRKSLVLFLKGAATPIALYVKDPEAEYRELQQILKMPTQRVIEKETNGPIKKISVPSNQITAVAIQEEQYV
ncbi:MAG: hypothetical protein DKM22_04680 [Candidatus Melainabacteria bacterium]|nr:MAG: hypothetical protein DKM22_04680 [Candidatus Melainabacteria bacterium]